MINREKRNVPVSEILLFFFFIFILSHFGIFSKPAERASETSTGITTSHLQPVVNFSNGVVKVYVKKIFPEPKHGQEFEKPGSRSFYSAIVFLKKSNILSGQIKALIQVNYHKLQKVPDEPWDLA